MKIDKRKYKKEFLLDLLNQMLAIRRFEERAAQAYGLKKIGGFLHLYIGQEASAVGAVANLDLKSDYVYTAYRDHGHSIAMGSDPKALMAELYGKADGISRGKGGSMHFFDIEKHMMGGNGIVGAHIPLAAGTALKVRYKKEKGAVLCFFGDGAIHQGSFHETLNLAKIWNLPVVFICENNHYGMGTDFKRVSSVTDFTQMAGAYDIPGEQVNGMDVLDVYEKVGKAVERAKKESKPSFLEIKTYRYKGHSMSDPGTYRTKEELEDYKNQDPIIVLKKAMIEAEWLTEEEFDKLDKTAKENAKAAADFAEKNPEPELETLYEDVLV